MRRCNNTYEMKEKKLEARRMKKEYGIKRKEW